MIDVGDYPEPNTKGRKWLVKLYVRFLLLLTFFKPENMTFINVFFELLHTFSRTLIVVSFSCARKRDAYKGYRHNNDCNCVRGEYFFYQPTLVDKRIESLHRQMTISV